MDSNLRIAEAAPESLHQELTKKMLAGLVPQLHRNNKPGRPPMPKSAIELDPTAAEAMALLAYIDILELIRAHINMIPNAPTGALFAQLDSQKQADVVFAQIKDIKAGDFINRMVEAVLAPDNPEYTITDIIRIHFQLLLGEFDDSWLPLPALQKEINHLISCITILVNKRDKCKRRTARIPTPTSLTSSRQALAQVVAGAPTTADLTAAWPEIIEGAALDDADAKALEELAATSQAPATPITTHLLDLVDNDGLPEASTAPAVIDINASSAAPLASALLESAPVATPLYPLVDDANMDETPKPAPMLAAPSSSAPIITPPPPRRSNVPFYTLAGALGLAVGIGLVSRNSPTTENPGSADTTSTPTISQPLVVVETDATLPPPSPIPEIPASLPPQPAIVSVSSSFTIAGQSSLELGVRTALLQGTSTLARCITRPNTDPRHLAYGLTAPITSFIRSHGWTIGTSSHPRGVTITWTNNGQCNDFSVTGWETGDNATTEVVHPETRVHITTPIATIVNNRALYHRLPAAQ